MSQPSTSSTELESGDLRVAVVGSGRGRRLQVRGGDARKLAAFAGTCAETADGTVLEGPLSPDNAAALRAHLPWLAPRPLGLATSAGTGDRLGVATPGHVRAFRRHGGQVAAIFAQQSIREMQRTERSPQHVLDDATFGCVEAGWTRAVGADADHLKTTDDVDRCLEAGFTLFTLDPGDHVRPVPANSRPEDVAAVPWQALEDDRDALLRRYPDRVVDLGRERLHLSEDEVLRAAAKYGGAVAHAVALYRHLRDRARYPVEVEVSVDETDEPTTVGEHLYIATELSRLGVEWVSFAPRYVGRFEKGVDYIGDLDDLARSLSQHAAVARAVGPYKLSLHSGSDKFSIYEMACVATDGLVHLKTAGTSYLEAVAVAASCEPSLFRDLYHVSREAYRGARASYHVSARLEETPSPGEVSDDALPGLLADHHTRQILHVGYGAVLTSRDDAGRPWLADALHAVLEREAERHAHGLEQHLGRHLRAFAEVA